MIVTTSITREAGAGAEIEAGAARNGQDPEIARIVIVMNGKALFVKFFYWGVSLLKMQLNFSSIIIERRSVDPNLAQDLVPDLVPQV
jgi:hypothetical protein